MTGGSEDAVVGMLGAPVGLRAKKTLIALMPEVELEGIGVNAHRGTRAILTSLLVVEVNYFHLISCILISGCV